MTTERRVRNLAAALIAATIVLLFLAIAAS